MKRLPGYLAAHGRGQIRARRLRNVVSFSNRELQKGAEQDRIKSETYSRGRMVSTSLAP